MFQTRYNDILLHRISKISKIHINKLRNILKEYNFNYNVKVIKLTTVEELIDALSINEDIIEIESCTTKSDKPNFYKTVFQEYNNKEVKIDIITGRIAPSEICECGEISKPLIDKLEISIFIKSITVLDEKLNKKTEQKVYIFTP